MLIKKANVTDNELNIILANLRKKEPISSKNDFFCYIGKVVNIGDYVYPLSLFYSKLYGNKKVDYSLSFIRISSSKSVRKLFENKKEFLIIKLKNMTTPVKNLYERPSFDSIQFKDLKNRKFSLTLPKIYGKNPEKYSIIEGRIYLPSLYYTESITVKSRKEPSLTTIKQVNGKFIIYPNIIIRNISDGCDVFLVIPDDATLYKVKIADIKEKMTILDEQEQYATDAEVALSLSDIRGMANKKTT